MGGGCFAPWPRRPYPDECCDALEPLGDSPILEKLLAPERFPRRAWNPDLLALVALSEFFATDWRSQVTLRAPRPFSDEGMRHEVEALVELGRTKRAERVGEIRDQDTKFHDYFAQLLMIIPQSHPETFNLFKMAARVAEALMVVFKLEHERPRPQQVAPRLMPLLDMPGHSSYPSGHALISRMIALSLAEVAPYYRTALLELSDRIALNREIAGLHFRSDSEAGFSIAEQAFPILRGCESYDLARRAAGAEWE